MRVCEPESQRVYVRACVCKQMNEREGGREIGIESKKFDRSVMQAACLPSAGESWLAEAENRAFPFDKQKH